MKIMILLTGITTILMLLSTLICGMWIKSNGVTDASSLLFHTRIGVGSVLIGCAFVLITLIYYWRS